MPSLRSLSLVALCTFLNATQLAAQPVCRPILTVKQEGFSEMFNLRRLWTGSIDVDASRCTTTSGLYSIGFIRVAENAPDLTFIEPFIWRLGQKKVAVEFWADEAVHAYWVADIAVCTCRSD